MTLSGFVVWIRQIIMKENFIPTIANFSTEDITDESRAKMKRDYMSQKEYNTLLKCKCCRNTAVPEP